MKVNSSKFRKIGITILPRSNSMYWGNTMFPKNNSEVNCIGFHKSFLPTLKRVITQKKIKWKSVSLYLTSCSGEFEYQGCLYEMSESVEMVQSIKLLKGNIVEGLVNGSI